MVGGVACNWVTEEVTKVRLVWVTAGANAADEREIRGKRHSRTFFGFIIMVVVFDVEQVSKFMCQQRIFCGFCGNTIARCVWWMTCVPQPLLFWLSLFKIESRRLVAVLILTFQLKNVCLDVVYDVGMGYAIDIINAQKTRGRCEF